MVNEKKEKTKHTFRRIFITGIAAMLPLVITFYLLKFMYSLVVSNLSPLFVMLATTYHIDIPESLVGIFTVFLLVAFILLVGILTRMYVGRLLLNILDKTASGIPFVKSIYNVIKQMIDSFGSTSKSFDRVVLVEFPKSEVYCVAFVVKSTQSALENVVGEKCLNIYVPTAPNPTSGFITVIPERNVHDVPIGVDEGLKFILSIGIINFNCKEQAEQALTDNIGKK